MSSKKSQNTISEASPRYSLEFSAGPGVAGKQSQHVKVAENVFSDLGVTASSNGIVTTVKGNLPDLAAGLSAAILEAFENGATHFRTVVRTDDELSAEARQHIEAMERVAKSLGGKVVSAAEATPEDIPIEWDNLLIAAVRNQPEVKSRKQADNLPPLVLEAEERFGKLDTLNRTKKREVISWLDEQNVFQVRKSVELLAIRMKVSRATVYNYLNAIRGQ